MSLWNLSLFDFLRVANPPLSCHCPGGGTTTQGASSSKKPSRMGPWFEFKLEALELIYGEALIPILYRRYKNLHNHPFVAETPFCEIYDEQCLEKLLAKWTQSIVCEALEKAQVNNENWTTNSPVDMVSGGAAKFGDDPPDDFSDDSPDDPPDDPPEKRRKRQTKKYRPDWAGIQRRPFSRQKCPNILPGETKPSSKWDHKSLPSSVKYPVPTHSQFIKPIQQLYTYCIQSKSRYGFLITDRELLVIRVGWMRGSRKRGYIEHSLIPWSNNSETSKRDSNTLT
ncbi:MAG: hypothetical protein Q9183_004936, partial [Haloplaca sp. 2 TL-2023]